MVKALASRRQQQKAKPAAVIDYSKYKIGVGKSVQMLTLLIPEKNNTVVEERFRPSLLFLYGKCPHTAQ
jgi:hypothetical protein